jgi:hypothetical protein
MTQPHDKPSGTDLSIDERLALVEALERREAGAVRKAAGIAWLSLIVAAVLLGLLVFGALSQLRRVRSEVAALDVQREMLVRSTSEQKAELARLDVDLRDRRAALSTLIAAIRRTDEEARGGLETALDADPRATTLVPRANVTIVDEQDRQWARNLSDRLQQAGVIPIGISYVREAAALQQFEVRYYEKAEEAGATRILAALKNVGVPAAPVYQNLETGTRVRRNHFEIWCPPNARQFKLPPMVPLTP